MNRGMQGFIRKLVLLGVLVSVSLGFMIWSVSSLAQGQEQKTSSLVTGSLATIVERPARFLAIAPVLTPARTGAPAVDELTDEIHTTLRETSSIIQRGRNFRNNSGGGTLCHLRKQFYLAR